MEFIVDQKVNRANWKEFYLTNKYSNVFQSPDFYDFYNAVKNQKAHVLTIKQNESIQALMVLTFQKEAGAKGYFSRRLICYGGPLVRDENPEAIAMLLNEAKSFAQKRAIYIEIRNSNDYSQFKDLYTKLNFEYIPYTNVQINLKSKNLEEVMKGMKYNRRREIRLSIDGGAQFREARNLEEVKILYGLLYNLYKIRVKLPLPTLEYFNKMFESNIGKVFISTHINNIIGGAFCFYDHKAIYTFYYFGNRNYKSKIYSTHMAILGAIDFALNEKIKCIDLMGAGKEKEYYGVRKYKLEFGGRFVKDGRFVHISNPVLYKIGNIGLKLMRKF